MLKPFRIKRLLSKRTAMLALIAGFSTLVTADCAKDCQQEYEDCLQYSTSVAKEKICGGLLHDCKLACATNGE